MAEIIQDLKLHKVSEDKFNSDLEAGALDKTALYLVPDDLSTKKDIVDLIYPIDSIYMSMNSISPATLFGGTWEQLQNGFLLSAGYNGINAGKTGGSPDAVVVSHNHTFSETTSNAGSHDHDFNMSETSTKSSGDHNHSFLDASGESTGHTLPAGKHTPTVKSVAGGSHAHEIVNWTESGGSERGGYKFNRTDVSSDANNKQSNLTTKDSTSHTHTITLNQVSDHTHQIIMANAAGHTHKFTPDITFNSDGSHTHTIEGEVDAKGESGKNANMPPYLAVYMWKRTA